MPNPSRPTRLPAQMRGVRDFYAKGQASLKDSPDRLGYGEANSSAGDIGLHPEMLRKARQIAQEFPAEKFERLLARCEARDFRIGITHLMRLASVSKGRAELIKRMLSGRWSSRRLNTEIAKVHPIIEGRGRRRQVAEDRIGRLIELKRECDRWIRWKIAPDSEVGRDVGKPRPGKRKALNAALADVLHEIVILRAAVIRELGPEKETVES
jgi:hypothetical protein